MILAFKKKTRKVHGSIRHKKVGGQDIHIKRMQGGGGEPLKWDDKGLREESSTLKPSTALEKS